MKSGLIPIVLANRELIASPRNFTSSIWTLNAVTAPSANSIKETANTTTHSFDTSVQVQAGLTYKIVFECEIDGRDDFRVIALDTFTTNPTVRFAFSGPDAVLIQGTPAPFSYSFDGRFARMSVTPSATGSMRVRVQIYSGPTGAGASYLGDITKGIIPVSLSVKR